MSEKIDAQPYARKSTRQLGIEDRRILDEKHVQNARPPRFSNVAMIVILVLCVFLALGVGVAVWCAMNVNRPLPCKGTGVKSLNQTCSTDRDCTSAYVCSANKCRLPANSPCTLNNQCEVGFSCIEGECSGLLMAPCTSTTQCGNPLTCIMNQCQ